MLKKFVSILLIVSLFAVVPLVSTELFKSKPREAQTDSPSRVSKSEILIGQLAALFSEDYCDETLTALAVILNTNYRYAKEHGSRADSNSVTKKSFLKKHGENYYSKIENTIKKASGKLLKYRGKAIRIPLSESDKESLPYLKNAPSPWYELDKSGAKGAVSIRGIDALCRAGLNYKQALRHYIEFD